MNFHSRSKIINPEDIARVLLELDLEPCKSSHIVTVIYLVPNTFRYIIRY